MSMECKKSKKSKDKLEAVIDAVEKSGMTYAEYQRKETLGLVKIARGKVLIKGKDYY